MKLKLITLLMGVCGMSFTGTAQIDNTDLWKGNNSEMQAGYNIGSFDLGADGGRLDSRWGVQLSVLRNIYLHRGAIGDMLKFGVHVGSDIGYLNFEKGHGSLDEISEWDYDQDTEAATIGKHYLAAGLAIGPTATVMPFIKSSNRNLARLKLRAFFHVVPSYAAFITSIPDDTEFYSAFCCYFSGGFNVIWRKLNIGLQWKGGRAKYNGIMGDISGENNATDLFYDGGKLRYSTKMFSINIGLAF